MAIVFYMDTKISLLIKFILIIFLLAAAVSVRAQNVRNEKKIIAITDSLIGKKKFNEAVRICDSVLEASDKNKTPTLYSKAACANIVLADNMHYTDMDSIRFYCEKSQRYAFASNNTQIIDSVLITILKISAQASGILFELPFLERIKSYIGTMKSDTRKFYAWYYYATGNYYQMAGDNEFAVEDYKKSSRYFHSLDMDFLAMLMCFKVMRNISLSGYDDNAIHYWYNFLQRLHANVASKQKTPDINTELIYYRTIARYLTYVKKYESALSAYDSSIVYYDMYLQKKHDDPKNSFNRFKYINITAYNYAYRIQYLENLGREADIDLIAKFASDSTDIIKDDLACLQFLLGRHYNNINRYDLSYKYYKDAFNNYMAAYGKNNYVTQKTMLQLLQNAVIVGEFEVADSVSAFLRECFNSGSGNSNTISEVLFHEINAKLYIRTSRYSLLQSEMIKAQEILSFLLRRNFGFMSRDALRDMWRRSDILCSRVLHTALILGDSITEDFAKAVYNSVLIQKNLLFLSQSHLKNISLSDTLLIKIYRSVSSVKAVLASEKSGLNSFERDSLYNIMRENELKLLAADTLQSKIIGTLSADFSSIKRKLRQGEVIVDFSEIFEYDKDYCQNNPEKCDNKYVAVVFGADSNAPEIIPLFARDELTGFVLSNGRTVKEVLKNRNPDNIDAIYSDTALTQLIWGKILEKIPKAKTIYFSPTGFFHDIAVGSLQLNDGKILQDKYNIVRVFNSADISSDVELFVSGGLAVFGGIEYMNSEIQRLPYSLEECDYIRIKAGQKGIPVSSYTGENAVVSNLTKYSGNSPYVLHIATHGYFDGDESDPESLENSSLAFADKNLTALEISETDFSNTGLAVLSACETGLGTINSNGLFGLERGFKLAGVDKIVMSLWNVVDDAAAYFMKKFYSYYLGGHSARESMKYAREVLREGNKFSHPYYWAGFVLVE